MKNCFNSNRINMENDGEHVTGRRLDVNGGNLIYFRGTEPKGMYGNSKRNDQDMLEFVRTQEQKLKIEKLKWLENDAKIASLQKHPTGTTLPTKPTPVSKVLPKPKPNDIEIKKPLKERPNPKQIADVIDNRNKRASQWLHKEQQEVSLLFYLIKTIFNINDLSVFITLYFNYIVSSKKSRDIRT